MGLGGWEGRVLYRDRSRAFSFGGGEVLERRENSDVRRGVRNWGW